MNSVTIRLPWPPTANTYFRSVVIGGSVRVLISKRGRQYRTDVQSAILERFGVPEPLTNQLRVTIVAYPPDRRQRDLDNIFKGLLDALTESFVWKDDNQIDDLRIIRGVVSHPGYVDVNIELLEIADAT